MVRHYVHIGHLTDEYDKWLQVRAMDQINQLLKKIRDCRECAAHLPLGPNPVVYASATARLLIIGQAPGTRVHATGIPWNDASGNRLRDWLQLDASTFYDTHRIAIMPMGFCYPGKGQSGDLPPRPECAPLWHARLLAQMPQIQLTLLIGDYAQKYYLAGTPFLQSAKTLTERVKHFNEAPSGFFPLPHPSPRNQLWLKKNPWFESTVIPALRTQIATVMG
ncbi:uracil-DNA glycosylase family protein [Neptuniibacter sp. CAU 1671]|uniref:uracil-DNA glycosylase family protein n=1 Tax=Neptuniibacter sp. CAU 1671 TaxID=3032593 RepID=UPI0031F45059